MFLLTWYRQYLELKQEFQREKICASCETLTMQLAIANNDKDKLLTKLVEKLSPPVELPRQVTQEADMRKPYIPQTAPWRVRQQMLEKEDREAARLMELAPKPQSETSKTKTDVDKLEQEIIGEDNGGPKEVSQS